ncbi:hypothetical protein V8D89_006876 [Ganoderma adspersum]
MLLLMQEQARLSGSSDSEHEGSDRELKVVKKAHMVGRAHKKIVREKPKANGKGKEKAKPKPQQKPKPRMMKDTDVAPKKASRATHRRQADDKDVIDLVGDDDKGDKSSGEGEGKDREDGGDNGEEDEESDDESLPLPCKRKLKKESTCDLMLIFGLWKDVDFPDEDGTENIKNGPWCEICWQEGRLLQGQKLIALPPHYAVTFRNILITMRPKTVKSELPTYSTVRSHITNCFVDFMNELKADIAHAPGDVNTMCDTWMVPYTSDPMFGLLVIWIDIQPDGT